ncbi:FAD-dependent thymidylate synthase [Patescibacteria group bacterium]|nr:FAD-dependent thymidylate synthase [Patescibacteria group bacterium]MBU2036317.1 FAD-dependent thymidylate synthase [Patescibacteria group bacterium]
MSLSALREQLEIPSQYPFPYKAEKFSKEEKKILDNFFTNTNKPVFAIYNLPQEVVGAMFSRYSRSEKSVRRLFLDEFWNSSLSLYKKNNSKLHKAMERTKKFYQRVFAEFGDDSVIQMGSIHVAFEYVSQIAAKAIEDQRIGSSYIEKSTRYVNFGSKINNHYLYMEAPEIKNSKFFKEYIKVNNFAFDSYNKHFETTLKYLENKYKIEDQIVEDINTGKSIKYSEVKDKGLRIKVLQAYKRALKAKAFDTIRIFLPTSTVTNLGAHFSGQSAENAINKMMASSHAEVRLLGFMAYGELNEIIPNFLQKIDHKHGEIMRAYRKNISEAQQKISKKYIKEIENKDSNDVVIVDYDKDADIKIASQILFTGQTKSYLSKTSIVNWVKKKKNLKKIHEIINEAVSDRKNNNINRRHKLSRAFEQAFAEIEFYTDFGIYRDLQRNRLSSTERLYLNTNEIEIPKEYRQKGMESVLTDYKKLHKMTKGLNKKILKSKELPFSSAEYVSILGHKLRFNVRANIRQWVFFSKLRTIPGGHSSYRNAMQKATKEILIKMPYLSEMFAKVDWVKDYGLGRFKAEIKTQEKLSKLEKK